MAALATAILRGLTSPAHLEDVLSRGPDVADLSYRDPLGRQLIHLAADSGDVSALRWLVSHGADPRSLTTSEGNSALHLAASEGHREAVAYLLEEASAGVAGVNTAGETALDTALSAGRDDVVRLLTRHLRPLPPPPSPQRPQPQQQQQQQQPQSQQQQQQQQEKPPTPTATATPGDHSSILSSNASKQPTVMPEEEGQQSVAEPPPPSEEAPAGSAGAAAAAAAMRTVGPDQATPTASLASAPPIRKGAREPPFDGRGMTKGGFFVAGAWSKAGVCSCFNVRHRHLLGKHGVVFDMGVCPSEVIHVSHVFVSHGHLDHCGAVVSHARLRGLSQGPPAKYYMCAQLAAGMEKVRRAFEEVEGDAIAMDIVAVGPDDSVDLGQGCFVRPFLVKHRVEALGFALMRRRSEGLKLEYRGMDGKALGALRKRGVDVSFSHESVEVVYTGDTVMSALASQPLVWRARLLIMEVTYLDGDGAAAAKNHHIHVKDVLDNVEKLGGVEQLLVAHVSERHGGYRNVLRLLAAALPPAIVNKVSIALGEFGAPQHLTFLEDYVLDDAKC